MIDGTGFSTLTDYEKTMFRLYKLGYVFQDYALVPDLTVMENVSLPAMLRKDRTEEQIEKGQSLTYCRRSACATGGTTSPGNSPAASSSGSRLPGRW